MNNRLSILFDERVRWLSSWVGKLFIIFIIYASLFFYFDRLNFDLDKDETHFWPTSLQFSKSYIPSIDLLKSYNELNTPLPFYIFGVIEKSTGFGPQGGRFLNFILSFVLVVYIALQKGLRPLFYGLGLLMFPYFIGTSVFLYTDILCAFFVFAGYLAYKKDRLILSMLFFILAISSRQYAIAFPVGILLYAALNQQKSKWLYVWMVLAIFSLLPWLALWNGFAPPSAVLSQNLSTASALRLFPDHSLYFMSCMGLYFVIPEYLIENGLKIPQIKNTGIIIMVLVILAGAFLIFPPLGNVDYSIPAMGYLDKVCRAFLPDVLRIFVFYILSALAALRFLRNSPETMLFWVNTLVMAKSHIGWDKYILPLLVCLWLGNAMKRSKGIDDAPNQEI